ncbi:MAG TPA: alpha-1,2-fucosyltransferase [Chryseolinea sp.]|nr:alpha-1,2-fucosyltransferase [Chryseolinea sp.]
MRSFRWRRGWLHEITVADLPEYSFKEDRYFDLNNEIFVASLMTRPFVFLFGRFFRDYGAMDLYQPLIREYFKPTQSIQQKVENHISKTRRGRDLLIGVHIRRGDYASYVGGRYFYSFEQYRQVMHSLTVSSKNRRLAFLICSNEEVDLSEFNGLDVISAPGQFVEDLYCLSLCDYIVGPPSTFSKWASFYGETPLYHIYSINRDVDLSDFKMLSPEVLYNFAFN